MNSFQIGLVVFTFAFTCQSFAKGRMRLIQTCGDELIFEYTEDAPSAAERLSRIFKKIPTAVARSTERLRAYWAQLEMPDQVRALGEISLNPLNARVRAAFNREIGFRLNLMRSRARGQTDDQRFFELGGAMQFDITQILVQNFPTEAHRRFIRTERVFKKSAYFAATGALPKFLRPGEIAIFRDGILVGRITGIPYPTYQAF